MNPTTFLEILPALAAPLLGVSILGFRSGVRRDTQILATRFKFELEEATEPPGLVLSGTYCGRSVRVVQTQSHNRWSSQVELGLSDSFDGWIAIQHKKRAAPHMLESPIVTGHTAFDQQFVVKSSRPDETRKLLSEEVILTFARWLPTMKAARSGGVELTGANLRFLDQGSIHSFARRDLVERALAMLRMLSDRLEPQLVTSARLTTPNRALPPAATAVERAPSRRLKAPALEGG